ncbi:hypothetical protein CCP3SC15_2540006 [Gammaproteobacteria bacterium]
MRTALQFEDLTSQLIQHLDRRINSRPLSSRASAPSRRSESMTSFTHEGRVERLRAAIAKASDLLAETEHITVSRQKMQAGDVEL